MVVLPVPLTPTTSTTPGWPSLPDTWSRRSMSGPTRLISSSRRTDRGSPDSLPSTRRRVRRASTSSWVGSTPTSAVSRVSSIASQVSSSRRSRESSESRPRPKPPCEPARRWRSRTSRDAVPSGFSSGAASGCLDRGVDGGGRLRRSRHLGGRRVVGGVLPPPASRGHETDGHAEGHHDDGDDQVEPVTHGDHPTSRRIRRSVRPGGAHARSAGPPASAGARRAPGARRARRVRSVRRSRAAGR